MNETVKFTAILLPSKLTVFKNYGIIKIKRIIMENLVVGQKVILKKEMLGEPVGSQGYVYEAYQDFDEPEKDAVSIVFTNGGYDGFSVKEQELFLEAGRVDQRYSTYQFKNVNQLCKDYQHGYWRF